MRIIKIDGWRISVPMVQPYHLSKIYGTLTEADVAIVRITLDSGEVGWGEADPGGIRFTGDTTQSVFTQLSQQARSFLGADIEQWLGQQHQNHTPGTATAAIDVACHDALGHATQRPVWQILGELKRRKIDLLWPTSSGLAGDDIQTIQTYSARGFHTFMLKMGSQPVATEIMRLRDVLAEAPPGVRFMVDANQGWTFAEACEFIKGVSHLPLVLIEQPLSAIEIENLHRLRQQSAWPISVDESAQSLADVERIVAAGAADVISIKVSKNGGLCNAIAIANTSAQANCKVLMNSMIELGITQAASLHLGCVLDNLLDCGHAYMSTLRMRDDISDFGAWVDSGTVHLPDRPGLGLVVDRSKIDRYQIDQFHFAQ